MPLHPATPSGRRRRQRAIRTARTELLPDASTLVDNITAVIAQATPAEVEDGRTWYARAHAIARDLCPHDPNQAAGVLAALSPQTSWHTNIGLAADAYANGTADLPHFADAIAKADAIANGADPLRILGGRKVRSFYTNIANPHRPGAVTIDRHAVCAAIQGPHDAHHWHHAPPTDARMLERPGIYHLIAAAYRTAAREYGILPHEAQAITWVTWRRITGADVHDNTERF